MYDVALKLCALAAVGLVAVGVLALISPRRLSRSYGVEVHDAASFAWVRATGVRDLILGAILGAATFADDTLIVLVICCAGLALSLADFLLALTFARRLRSEHGAHLGGAVAFLVIIILIMQSSGGAFRP
ncbi:MAG TPA: DUF4267 domain-containing protein [Candidatus Aquilonibacter sp.]|nr:DUF4267 domain-containing protein [Candidatus Aquilonibacter sp.]